MKQKNMSTFAHVRSDVLASLVIVCIAVPLSLGIAMASGMPPLSAITAAIIGGILVGFMTGAPIVVSGPAAGLAAIVFTYAHDYGVTGVYTITILAGIIQLVLGSLRMGRYIALMPKAILEGVLSAIGVSILLGQLHVLMGQKMPGKVLSNLTGLPHSLSQVFDAQYALGIHPAFACGLLALAIQLVWPKLMKKVKWLPGALPATLLGTALALSFDIPRVQLGALWPHVAEAFSLQVQNLELSSWLRLLSPALALAIVASAESLLTARAMDVLVQKKHAHLTTNFEKELMAQGCGNIVSGVCGGMPITGVMVRSAANFEAGAVSRYSTMMHGGLILLGVVSFPWLLEKIPLAVLAAILVLTGWKLFNVKGLISALRYHPRQAYSWPLTMAAILATDLLKGLLIGLGVWLLDEAFQKYYRKPEAAKAVVKDTQI